MKFFWEEDTVFLHLVKYFGKDSTNISRVILCGPNCPVTHLAPVSPTSIYKEIDANYEHPPCFTIASNVKKRELVPVETRVARIVLFQKQQFSGTYFFQLTGVTLKNWMELFDSKLNY